MPISMNHRENIIPESMRIFTFSDRKNPVIKRQYQYYEAQSANPKRRSNSIVLEEIGAKDNYILKSVEYDTRSGEISGIGKFIKKGKKYESLSYTPYQSNGVNRGSVTIADFSVPADKATTPRRAGLTYIIDAEGNVKMPTKAVNKCEYNALEWIAKNIETYAPSTKAMLKRIFHI